LLKKQIDIINPCFANYLRDATLDRQTGRSGAMVPAVIAGGMVKFTPHEVI